MLIAKLYFFIQNIINTIVYIITMYQGHDNVIQKKLLNMH